jgi:hypothetical protein
LESIVRSFDGPILIALPSTYLLMILADLRSLESKTRHRLRVFSRIDVGTLPPALQPYVMPYDARFDGAGTRYPGTQVDFAQRALLHFVENILTQEPTGTHQSHAAAVEESIATLKAPSIPKRKKLSDGDVMHLIQEHWDLAQGQSSRMLRVLRDDLEVACEQSRFRDLFNEVKAKRAAV